MATKFKHLKISNWRQYANIDIEFHKQMTILTGANGAGKTTILNLLSRHFGWSIHLVGTLSITKSGAWKYFSGSGRDYFNRDENAAQRIGSLRYDNGTEAELSVLPQVNENYQVSLSNQQAVTGIYITSHRPVYSYQRVDQIPTKITATNQLFEEYVSNLQQYYNPQARIQSPSFRIKSALISLATFGYGNRAVEANDDARDTFESFQEVLRKILPPDLEFQEIRIRLPDVLLHCRNNEFSIDAASGGVSALIDLAWQIHMKSLTVDGFVVVLDEPENHLHPRLQRTVLPSLIKAFPQAQFVAATHNPFVVTSVPDSSVVVLDFYEGKVKSTNMSAFDRAASANQVLADVLGVPFPMPMWVEDHVDSIVRSLEGVELTAQTLTRTKQQLADLGLGDMFPEIIDRLIPGSGDST